MKNQKSVQLVKSSDKIVTSKSAATPSAESGEIVKFDEAGCHNWRCGLKMKRYGLRKIN